MVLSACGISGKARRRDLSPPTLARCRRKACRQAPRANALKRPAESLILVAPAQVLRSAPFVADAPEPGAAKSRVAILPQTRLSHGRLAPTRDSMQVWRVYRSGLLALANASKRANRRRLKQWLASRLGSVACANFLGNHPTSGISTGRSTASIMSIIYNLV
jgi:hypothetical protein